MRSGTWSPLVCWATITGLRLSDRLPNQFPVQTGQSIGANDKELTRLWHNDLVLLSLCERETVSKIR